MQIFRIASKCGGYRKPKGKMDSQMYPECAGTPEDRDVVKKNRKKKKKHASAYMALVHKLAKIGAELQKLTKTAQTQQDQYLEQRIQDVQEGLRTLLGLKYKGLISDRQYNIQLINIKNHLEKMIEMGYQSQSLNDAVDSFNNNTLTQGKIVMPEAPNMDMGGIQSIASSCKDDTGCKICSKGK